MNTWTAPPQVPERAGGQPAYRPIGEDQIRGEEQAGLEVYAFWSDLDDVPVVQVDKAGGRVRVAVNDAVVYDGDVDVMTPLQAFLAAAAAESAELARFDSSPSTWPSDELVRACAVLGDLRRARERAQQAWAATL